MLKDPLFRILSTDHQQNVITAVLDIDVNSEIFAGHFPGQPVVPGACMLQLIKEVLIRVLNKPLRLGKADNIKFLTLIQPTEGQIVTLQITYSEFDANIKATASLNVGDMNCMKFQGIFRAGD